MKWMLPSLNLDMCIVANRDVSQKLKQNGSVDPDETAWPNYPCLEQISTVPKMFESLKFD